MTEAQLQALVASFLKLALDPHVFWFHPVNEGKRGWKAQRDFKRFGGRSGVPDLLFAYQGRMFGIELKNAIGYASAEQTACHMDLNIAGVPVKICRSVDEVQLALMGWRIPLRAKVAA